MCNSGEVLSGICGLSGPRMFGDCSAFQAVQSTIDRAVLGVRVAHDHLQATVSRELLEGLDVGPRFGEAGDARMTEGVASTASSRANDASSLSSISCAKDRPDCEAAPADGRAVPCPQGPTTAPGSGSTGWRVDEALPVGGVQSMAEGRDRRRRAVLAHTKSR